MSWGAGGVYRQYLLDKKREVEKVRERESNRITALLWTDRRNFRNRYVDSKPVTGLSDLLAKNRKK